MPPLFAVGVLLFDETDFGNEKCWNTGVPWWLVSATVEEDDGGCPSVVNAAGELTLTLSSVSVGTLRGLRIASGCPPLLLLL